MWKCAISDFFVNESNSVFRECHYVFIFRYSYYQIDEQLIIRCTIIINNTRIKKRQRIRNATAVTDNDDCFGDDVETYVVQEALKHYIRYG